MRLMGRAKFSRRQGLKSGRLSGKGAFWNLPRFRWLLTHYSGEVGSMSAGQQGNNQAKSQNAEGADWDDLKGEVGDIAGEAVERGRSFIYAARDQATDYADKRKDAVAQSVADFANSLRESTTTFEDRPNIRAVVDSAAEGLDQLAGSIRERSYGEIFSDVEEVMRQRPAAVVAVSVALGFLTARFIKSTAADLRHEINVSGAEIRSGRKRPGQGASAQKRA
jgi:hypothetical protein